MGGLKGVAGLLGAVLTKVFAKDIANGIETAVHNFQVFTGQAEKSANAMALKFKQAADTIRTDSFSLGDRAEATTIKDQIDFSLKLRDVQSELTDRTREHVLEVNELTKQYAAAYVEAQKLIDTSTEKQGQLARDLKTKIVDEQAENGANASDVRDTFVNDITNSGNNESLQSKVSQFAEDEAYVNQVIQALDNLENKATLTSETFQTMGNELEAAFENSSIIEYLGSTADENIELKQSLDASIQILKNEKASQEERAAALEKIREILGTVKDGEDIFNDYLQDTVQTIVNGNTAYKEHREELRELGQEMRNNIQVTNEGAQAEYNYQQALKEANAELERARGAAQGYAAAITTTCNAISQLYTAVQSLTKA